MSAAALAQAQAAAKAKLSEASPAMRRVVAVRISDLPVPSQEPLGGLTLEDVRQFFIAIGTIDKISCSPFPFTGPVLHIDVLIKYQDPKVAMAAVSAYHGSSMTGSSNCNLSLTLFQADDVPIEPGDPLAWDLSGDPVDDIGSFPSSLGLLEDHTIGDMDTHSGHKRVVLAHVTSLSMPDVPPLGGLSLNTIQSVFSQFGMVEKIACTTMPKSGLPLQAVDAMIQFAEGSAASMAVQSLDGISLTQDGRNVAQMKYSKHVELRTHGNSERTRVFVGPGAMSQIYESTSTQMKRPIGEPVGSSPGSYEAQQAKRPRKEISNGETRRVLLLHLTELPRPDCLPLGGLKVDNVHTACAPFGLVEKVVCVAVPKTGRPPVECVDAMVQFDTPTAAVLAMQQLDGSFLSPAGSCRIQAKWSRHTELAAQGESDTHRDFTGGASTSTSTLRGLSTNYKVTDLADIFAKIGSSSKPAGGRSGVGAALSAASVDVRGGLSDPNATPVAAVFNLPEELANVDVVFNLFSLYGYVSIVKILFKQPRDAALVQFSEASFVDLAIERLQGAILGGKQLEVRRSKQGSLRCTEKDQTAIERTTHSFSISDQFWSRKDYDKIWDNAASPSQTLFIKNISPQVGEEELLSIFRQHGTILDFAFLPFPATARYKTAAVQMSSIPEAVLVVALAQRERFANPDGGEDMRLMVCFSKKDEMPKNAVRHATEAA